MLSASREFYRVPLPRLGARMVGKGRPKVIAQKMPYDFFFVHRSTGKAIALDAKSSDHATRFSLSDSHVPLHQKQCLIEAGQNGIISGLLIECRGGPTKGVCWLDHAILKRFFWREPLKSIEWTSPELLWLAPANQSIDLGKLIRR